MNTPTLSHYGTAFDVDACLAGRKLYGMNFGLERMQKLLAQLDNPQREYRSIHVVGTNGKSSTNVAISSLLQRVGLSTGAYISPHLRDIRERILLGEKMIDTDAFAQALALAEASAQSVDREHTEEDQITQFELLTATAFLAFKNAGIDVAIIEAGLGGRYDATNVLPSTATVLTNVELEHTQWLGTTHAAIAREKVAVLQPASALITTTELHADAHTVAQAAAQEHGAEFLAVSTESCNTTQAKNIALATAAAQWYCDQYGFAKTALTRETKQNNELTPLAGRLEQVSTNPPTFFDGAHNPAAAAALAQHIQRDFAHQPIYLVVGILSDKDGASIAKTLAPLATAVITTASGSTRDLSPHTLAYHFTAATDKKVDAITDPHHALASAQKQAKQTHGMVLVTGSLKLIAKLHNEKVANDL